MALDSKKQLLDYFSNNAKKLPFLDYEELAPKYLGVTLSHLTSELNKRKLALNAQNITELLLQSIEASEWEDRQILKAAASLELEVISRKKRRYKWQAHYLTDLSIEDYDEPFDKLLLKAIKDAGEDALIVMKAENGLLWLAVLYKRFESDGLHEEPHFFAISEDYLFLFISKSLPFGISKAISKVTGCEEALTVNMQGFDVPSLLKLLRGWEQTDEASPEISQFTFGPARDTGSGVDYTQRATLEDYAQKIIDSNININEYKVKPRSQLWLGDDTPELRLFELHSEVKFSGNVSHLLSNIVTNNICTPPFPSYIRNFMTIGKSDVTATQNPCNL